MASSRGAPIGKRVVSENAIGAERLAEMKLAVVVGAAHVAALLIFQAGRAPLATEQAFVRWLLPIVLFHLAALRVSGALRPELNNSHREQALRLLSASLAATALLATCAVVLQGASRHMPVTVLVLGGGLSLAVLCLVSLPSWRPSLLLGGVASVLALVMAEAFLRLVFDPLDPRRFVPKTPYAKYRELMLEDSELGFRLRPNSHVIFEREDVDYYRMDVRINSIGIRDGEYDRKKQPGVRRIVFVGDSIVFGAGIELHETVPKLLEARLNESAGHAVSEVMNWGVGSYNLSQELGLLRRARAESFEPDLLLVGTSPNDFGQSLKPNTYRNQTGLLATEEDHSRFAGAERGLLSLRTDRLLRFWLQKLLPSKRLARDLQELSQTEEARSTLRDLTAFRDYASSSGVRIAFVLFPGEGLVDAAAPGRQEQLVYELMKLQIEALGMAYLDCLPTVRDGTKRLGRLYVRWDAIHFNARGTAVIAEALAGFLREPAFVAPVGALPRSSPRTSPNGGQ